MDAFLASIVGLAKHKHFLHAYLIVGVTLIMRRYLALFLWDENRGSALSARCTALSLPYMSCLKLT